MEFPLVYRLYVLNVLFSADDRQAPQYSMEDLVVIKSIIDKVALTVEEVDAIKLETKDGQINWDNEKDPKKVIDFLPIEKKCMLERLEEFSKNKKINQLGLELYQELGGQVSLPEEKEVPTES